VITCQLQLYLTSVNMTAIYYNDTSEENDILLTASASEANN